MPLNAFPYPFIKAEATGNDFIIIDLIDSQLNDLFTSAFGATPRPSLVKKLSDRHFGLGADGVVFLEGHATPASDFSWDFYNSDGGSAEMCGNAARAVSLYIHLSRDKKSLRFQTRVGVVFAQIHSCNDIEVELPAIREQKWDEQNTDFVNSGVPHVVVRTDDIRNHKQMREIALMHRLRPEFKQSGTNVTFVRTLGPHAIESVTFERGVDDFTLACGTGAIAAAHSVLRGKPNQNVQVTVPGGKLGVEFKDGRPHLRGPAHIVGEMRWIKE